MRVPWAALGRAALVFCGWLLVGLLVFRGLVFEPGVVADGDLGSPLDETLTLQYHASTWNPWAQGFSIHPPKLVLVAPMTALTFLGIPDETVAKLYLPVILAIAGTSGSLTLLAILRDRPPAARWAGALVGGAALALDPWALSRLMAHYWLVLGYALWPPAVWLYWRALEEGARPGRLAILAALLAVQGVQLHLVFQTALVMAFVGAFHLATAPSPRPWLRFLRVTGATVALFVGFSAFWLVPFGAAAFSIGTAPAYAVTEDVVSLLSRNQHPSWVLAG
ncbi:MAG TPA: hypothetical protein VNX21_01830, partial [Candidatus Thermoplasmatota archaeon]|nr:hypothetical protein [Candidatus Thermoplasmatota archaeon]